MENKYFSLIQKKYFFLSKKLWKWFLPFINCVLHAGYPLLTLYVKFIWEALDLFLEKFCHSIDKNSKPLRVAKCVVLFPFLFTKNRNWNDRKIFEFPHCGTFLQWILFFSSLTKQSEITYLRLFVIVIGKSEGKWDLILYSFSFVKPKLSFSCRRISSF